MCWMLREPRREDHTTWTAVAPDPVFTVLTYGTSQLYGPSLVRKSASRKSRNPQVNTMLSPQIRDHEPSQVALGMDALAGWAMSQCTVQLGRGDPHLRQPESGGAQTGVRVPGLVLGGSAAFSSRSCRQSAIGPRGGLAPRGPGQWIARSERRVRVAGQPAQAGAHVHARAMPRVLRISSAGSICRVRGGTPGAGNGAGPPRPPLSPKIRGRGEDVCRWRRLHHPCGS
jgi:hypothetical protein